MHELRMLLVDLTTYGADENLSRLLDQHFTLKRPRISQVSSREHSGSRPHVICFEFDYPDTTGLELLRTTKQLCPSIPIIMITKQHSEDLAVWAFRSCAWDFFVKPMTDADIKYIQRRLTKIEHRTKEATGVRYLIRPTLPVPQDSSLHGKISPQSAVMPAAVYVEENLGEKIVERDVAKLCNLSVFKFCRSFREVYGETFKAYVVRTKMAEAQRLLNNPHASISEVAYQVGFDDPSYFSRVFKKQFGATPSELHNQMVEAKTASLPTPSQIHSDHTIIAPMPETNSWK